VDILNQGGLNIKEELITNYINNWLNSKGEINIALNYDSDKKSLALVLLNQ
jgi:hypothetical protein